MAFLRSFCTIEINKISKNSPKIATTSCRNHGTFLQKSPRKVAEITATSCGNPKEKLRKSPRKVAGNIKKNTVKMLNVGECR